MAWHGGNGAHSVVQLQFLSASGTPTRPSIAISDGDRDAYEPDLQAFGDNLLLGWYEKDTDGVLQACVALFDREGVRRWERVISADGRNGRNIVVRAVGGQIMAAWIESGIGAPPAIWTVRLDARGTLLGPARRAADASFDTWNLNADADSSALYVVYDARLGTRSKELQLLRITAEDITARALTADDGWASVYPDLALSDDHAALTWFDYRDGDAEMCVATGSLASWLAGARPTARRVIRTPGASIGAYAAWNGSQLGVAWSQQTANGYDVRLQRFDADGRPSGDVRSLSAGDTRSLIPAIRPWHHGFAVAWNDYRPGSSSTAMLRRLE